MTNLFHIDRNLTKVGYIQKHGNKYRVQCGKRKIDRHNVIVGIYDNLEEAENCLSLQRKLKTKQQFNTTLKLIDSINYSGTWKKLAKMYAINVFENDIRNKIDFEMIHHLGKKYSDARKNAKKKGRKFNITFDYILYLYWKTKGICPISKEKFQLNIENKEKWSRNFKAPSIDRKFNNKGYVFFNIEIMSWQSNRMKHDMNFKDMYRISLGWIEYIHKNKLLDKCKKV